MQHLYVLSIRTCLDDTHENGEQQLTGNDFEKNERAYISSEYWRVKKDPSKLIPSANIVSQCPV